jgi:hypothetical protein
LLRNDTTKTQEEELAQSLDVPAASAGTPARLWRSAGQFHFSLTYPADVAQRSNDLPSVARMLDLIDSNQ